MRISHQHAQKRITVASQREVSEIQSAGFVLVVDYSPQAAVDYLSGPNHVLPTGGTARFRSGLSVNDFVKLITVQEFTARGLQTIAREVSTLAQAEGLVAHAHSIAIRMGA